MISYRAFFEAVATGIGGELSDFEIKESGVWAEFLKRCVAVEPHNYEPDTYRFSKHEYTIKICVAPVILSVELAIAEPSSRLRYKTSLLNRFFEAHERHTETTVSELINIGGNLIEHLISMPRFLPPPSARRAYAFIAPLFYDDPIRWYSQTLSDAAERGVFIDYDKITLDGYPLIFEDVIEPEFVDISERN